MKNLNQPSSASESQQVGLMQKIASLRALAFMGLLSLGAQSLVACGTNQNRDNNDAPKLSLNGASSQNEFPFGVTAESANGTKIEQDSAEVSTMEGGKAVDIQSTTLQFKQAGEQTLTAYAKADCENGQRPDPAVYLRTVNPGVNAPVNVVFDTQACELAIDGGTERDTDEDGIIDSQDNCFARANADQADIDSDGLGDVCDSIDNRPVTDPTTPAVPAGRIELHVEEPSTGTSYIASANANTRIDEPSATAPRTALTDAQGDAAYTNAECGVNITRTISKTPFTTSVKSVQIPCTGDQTYRNTIRLENAPTPNTVGWDRASYAVADDQCFNADQMLVETDGAGAQTLYAGPVTLYSNNPTDVTVNNANGQVCAVNPGAAADVTASTGTQVTPNLRVITY